MTPAQTDTPRVDRCETEIKAFSPTMSLVEMTFLARQLERELSQAVKVAGQLANFRTHNQFCNGALQGRCSCGLDKVLSELQRITGGEG